ncbi:hypothetical protein D9M73_164050 [compost metagenome]
MKRPHDHIDVEGPPVAGQAHPPGLDTLARMVGLEDRRAQLKAQVRLDQREDVMGRFAGHMAQELARTIGAVDDVAVRIEDDARRRILFEHALMDLAIGKFFLAHGRRQRRHLRGHDRVVQLQG